MSNVTEADETKAMEILSEYGHGDPDPFGEIAAAIAKALADERAKARAPFLAGVQQIREIASEAAKVVGCEEFAVRVAMVTKEMPR